MRKNWIGGALLIAAAALPAQQQTSQASSHREAPFIARLPKVDGTDFYMFRSYETGRSEYVTFIANYQPLQHPYGGPNYFTMDPDAIYEIHVDNTSPGDPLLGDGIEDITFQFDFDTALAAGGQGIALDVGPAGNTKSVAIPLGAAGPISTPNAATQNVLENYQIKIIRGDRRTGQSAQITKAGGGQNFEKPVDNIGAKTIANYGAYAAQFVFDIDIPGCTPPAAGPGRVFVGQREEGFAVNLGQIFDLANLSGGPVMCAGGAGSCADVLGAQNQGFNTVNTSNVTSIAIEVPIACLQATGGAPLIGAWTTSSVRQARVINPTGTFEQPSREGGPWVQVSRLGNPLVNEVVIGLRDKDKFNNSEPKDDLANFADYVTNPTLPELVELLFGAAGVEAPNNFPRTDLVEAFVTGIDGGTMAFVNGAAAEYLRLRMDLPASAFDNQYELGAAGCVVPTPTGYMLNIAAPSCDLGGFPNGRRPGDDVVDLALRVAMGVLAGTDNTATGLLPYTDGAGFQGLAVACDPVTRGAGCDSRHFDNAFPYLNTPYPGSP
jgi:hypothetical protein